MTTGKPTRINFLLGVMDNNFGDLQNSLGDVTFNQYESFDLVEFSNEADGILVGKEIADWEKEAARLDWEGTRGIADAEIVNGTAKVVEGFATIAEGAAKMVEGAAKAGYPLGSIGEGGAKIAQGVSKMVAGEAKIVAGEATRAKGANRKKIAHAKKLHYENIKDKTKRSDQDIKLSIPPPRPQAVFGRDCSERNPYH